MYSGLVRLVLPIDVHSSLTYYSAELSGLRRHSAAACLHAEGEPFADTEAI